MTTGAMAQSMKSSEKNIQSFLRNNGTYGQKEK